MLKNNEIILNFNKCYFAYSSIQVLKHYVFKLSFNITKEKIKIIRQIKFLTILRNFKMKLNFFEYYRFFVNHFVNIVKSLVRLKIRNFINVSIKSRRKKNHFNKTCLKQRD